MAQILEKFYSSFGGVDSRSNKLLMDPRTFRKGSKNFRYNFQDEIQKANGFQHRMIDANIVDIFEYKFRDVNTGQSKSETLCVKTDGRLYKQVAHTLQFITTGAATSYSFYYDETADLYKFSMNGVGSVDVSDVMTMSQLAAALNVMAGVSVRIIDQFGDITVASTKLAYFMKVTIKGKFKDNQSQFWTVIPYPDVTCTAVAQKTEKTVDYLTDYTWHSVPFPTTVKANDPVTYPSVAENYEGISSTSLNNSIYITDGGFLMKYDGKTVYRAGVPHLSYQDSGDTGTVFKDFSPSGITTAINGGGANDLDAGNYYWSYRLGFQDYSGANYYGTEVRLPSLAIPPINPGTKLYADITIQALRYGKDFPVFSARVSGNQGNTTGDGITLVVNGTHNILPGMIIRQDVKTSNTANKETRALIIGLYSKVVSVNSTGLVLQSIACTAGDLAYVATFLDNDIVTGYYTQEFYESKVPDSDQVPPGFFVEVYRTKKDQNLGPLYQVFRTAVPLVNGDTIVIRDNKPDTQLVAQFIDAEPGEELPRAGKYVTSWQGFLTQAGSPPDWTLKDGIYPTTYALPAPQFCSLKSNTSYLYTEAAMCDFQSIYWADPNSPEGFSFDGLHEFLIDSPFSDKIKGIAQNKDALFVMKERSTGIVSGDIAANLGLEILEDDIGCVSHKTIKDVRGSLVWLDGEKGFYSCVAGRLPVHIGYPVSDYQQINAEDLDYSKAVAANCREIDMYFCAVGSTWFVFDYSETDNGGHRNCWYIWERFSVKSMVFTSTSEFYLLGSDSKVWALKNTETRWDFTDHKDAIEINAITAWINKQMPTIDKNWERVWVNSIQGNFKLKVEQYANYLDPIIGTTEIFMKPGTEKQTVKDYVKLCPDKLSAVSIGFKNTEKNTFVRIQGFEIEMGATFDPNEARR